MRVIKITKVIFRRRVIDNELGICSEGNIDLKIESAVGNSLTVGFSTMKVDITFKIKLEKKLPPVLPSEDCHKKLCQTKAEDLYKNVH